MFYSPIIGYTMDSNFRAASLTLYPSDKKKKKAKPNGSILNYLLLEAISGLLASFQKSE